MGKRKSIQEDDNGIVKYEQFDKYAALRMLEDPTIAMEDKVLLRQLLNHSRDGVAEVTYHASKTAVEDEGGLYAPRWSLQNLPKHIRSSLVHDIAFDLDIVNSQPTILLGLMRKFGYPENKMFFSVITLTAVRSSCRLLIQTVRGPNGRS